MVSAPAVDSAARMEALAARLHHPDPSQLAFQIREIAGERAYQRHGVRVDADDTVVDAGANVGVAAVYFAAVCGAGRVHSLEPIAPLFELLERNVAGLDACRAHNLGLGSRSGRAAITYYPGAAAMSGLYADPGRDRELVRAALANEGLRGEQAERWLEGRHESRQLDCELTTLSAFMAAESIEAIDLLKVDVERAELDVLEGIEPGDWPKIRQLAVEVHDEAGRAQRVRQLLGERGFHVILDQDEAMRGTSVRMVYATTLPAP